MFCTGDEQFFNPTLIYYLGTWHGGNQVLLLTYLGGTHFLPEYAKYPPINPVMGSSTIDLSIV
jgi:hypothetical protein